MRVFDLFANFAPINIIEMVKHVVQFRFSDNVSEAVRTEAALNFQKGILALKDIIPTIRKIEVGFNINPAEQWNICLYSEFDTLEDVVAYGNNPDHKKVAGALKPLLSGRSCVDYKTE